MTPSIANALPVVMRVDLPEQQVSEGDGEGVPPSLRLLDDIPVHLHVRLGTANLTVKALMALRAGAVVELDRLVGDPIDVQLNHKTIARAEIVAVGEQFGIRITDILADP